MVVFTNYLVRCVDEVFAFFALRCRDLLPRCYDNTLPLSLVAKKSSSCVSIIGLYRNLLDKLEVLLPLFHLHISCTGGYLRLWTSQRGLLSNTLLGWGRMRRICYGSQFNASLGVQSLRTSFGGLLQDASEQVRLFPGEIYQVLAPLAFIVTMSCKTYFYAM